MARTIEVNDDFREAVRQAIDAEGLGVTSPELHVSREMVRNLLSGSQERFNVGKLAQLCLAVRIPPVRLVGMGLTPLAREVERRGAGGDYVSELIRAMAPRNSGR